MRLYSKQSAQALPVILDPDPHITCEFMDGRDSFLSTARDRHWEFSSLRRAKFSTLALCYEIHTQGSDKFVYTCNTCKNTNAKWHCSECDVSCQCFRAGCQGSNFAAFRISTCAKLVTRRANTSTRWSRSSRWWPTIHHRVKNKARRIHAIGTNRFSVASRA